MSSETPPPPQPPARPSTRGVRSVSPEGAARQLAVLQAVLEGMAVGLWITDDDGIIVQHNTAVKEMLYTGVEIAGHHVSALLDSPELADAVQRACTRGQTSRLEVSVEGVRPCTLSVHVWPLGRELGGSAASFFDVTELRHLEKVRKDFVANVSHELRTPITAIRGYAETLQGGALNDPTNAPKMVDIIVRQSERLSALVEDLLELSRLESRQIQLQEKPVDLLETAQRACEAVRPRAVERGISVHLEIPEKLSAVGDERGVEQIILNLVDNAVKYTPQGGHVWVTAQIRGNEAELRVKDDGAGIEARHLPRIFERFYRVDKGRSRDMGGTGLGLSIVKHLATAMGGEASVESRLGQGSTFVVQLPLAPAAEGGNPPPAE